MHAENYFRNGEIVFEFALVIFEYFHFSSKKKKNIDKFVNINYNIMCKRNLRRAEY
jgi:hypothetical protein